MNLLSWKYKVDGRDMETPLPFRGKEMILAIGKSDEEPCMTNEWESVEPSKFPNRIYMTPDFKVHISIPKHKNTSLDYTYTTELTAGKELTKILLPFMIKQYLDEKDYLFYKKGGDKGRMTEDTINGRLKDFIRMLGSRITHGSRAFRHMFAEYAADCHSGRECNYIAQGMRHSVSTQQNIYAQESEYPKWEDAVEGFEDYI